MTTLCFLCPKDKISEARNNTEKYWPNISKNHTFLSTPLSEIGSDEIVYYFCMLSVPDNKVQEYIDKCEYSIVEQLSKEECLRKYGLRLNK